MNDIDKLIETVPGLTLDEQFELINEPVTDKVNEIEKEIKLIKTNFTKSKYYEL